jgi:hypothetical protein
MDAEKENLESVMLNGTRWLIKVDDYGGVLEAYTQETGWVRLDYFNRHDRQELQQAAYETIGNGD